MLNYIALLCIKPNVDESYNYLLLVSYVMDDFCFVDSNLYMAFQQKMEGSLTAIK